MNTLSTASDLQLQWVQPTMLMRHFKLYSQNGAIGELLFEKAATAHGVWSGVGSPTARWMIKGGGLLKRGVTIRLSEAKNDLAVFRPNFMGEGWVEFLEGSRFHWKSRNFWRTEWGFFNLQKELLFVLKSQPWYQLKTESTVEIGGQWRDLDQLPLLIMLGWYLRIQNFYAGW